MRQYLLKRVLLLVPILLILSFVIFALMRIIPGDAALIMVAGGPDVGSRPEAYEAMKQQLGLDKPYHQQYAEWMANMLLRGDMGESFWSKRPVLSEIVKALPVSIELAIGTTIVSLIIALPVGVISALRQDTPLDYLVRLLSIGGLSVPGFWIGTILIVYPAVWWGYIPPLNYVSPLDDPFNNFRQFLFPSIAMGAAFSATAMRMTRSQMLEVLRQDYIRTAWAKGLRERTVVFRHALKNAMVPIITIVGLDFGYLFGRTVVMETVFLLPGIGRLTLEAIFRRDYPQIQGNILFIGAIFVLVNLLVDLTYAWLDPRIRYQ